MHRTRRAILEIVTRAPTPFAPTRIARIDNLQGDGRTAPDTIVVSIEAACRELKAAAAGAPTVRLASAVDAALEELLVDGAVVDARATRPLPSILAAVASTALKAVILWQTQHCTFKATNTQDLPKWKQHHQNHLVHLW